MGKLIEVVGLITVILAVLYIGVTKTAFQETTIAIMWCGGWMMVASGMIVRRLDQLIDVTPRNP
jgi:hypothetical protein